MLDTLPSDDLASAYSDCFKSEFGFRPRWGLDDRRAMIDYLESYEARIDELRAEWEEEERLLDEREARWEQERREARTARLEAEEDALLESLTASASRRRRHVLPTHRR